MSVGSQESAGLPSGTMIIGAACEMDNLHRSGRETSLLFALKGEKRV